MAKTIEVLLTKDILKLGDMGDIVKVKSGYARNYLLPNGYAIQASAAAKRQIEVLREQAQKNALEREAKAAAMRKDIDGVTVEISGKVAHDRVLFGSVGIRDIVRALSASGFDVDQRQVHLHENIKELGSYQVLLKLAAAIEATVTVNVLDADPNGVKLDDILAEQNGEDAPAEAAAE